jgi:hypothetical protein
MTDDYNIAAIRQLLLNAFTAQELHSFCFDRPVFHPIVNLFGPKLGLTDMVGQVIEYCYRHVLLDKLLAEVQQFNPAQYALFESDLLITEPAEEEEGPSPPPPIPSEPEEEEEEEPPLPIPRRSWWMLVLLLSNLGLVLFWGWCLLRDQPELMAYLQTVFTILGVLVAVLALIFVTRRPVAWGHALHRLGTRPRWLYVILALTTLNVAVFLLFCPSRRPTAYMELVLDNGPAPEPHQVEELKAVLQEELSRALPDAALALRVFGLDCSETERMVSFSRGNAAKVVEALDDVQPVPRAETNAGLPA